MNILILLLLADLLITSIFGRYIKKDRLYLGVGMGLLLGGLASSIIPSLFKGGAGIWQRGQANRLERANPFPSNLEKTIPESVLKATEVSKGLSNMGDLPGGQIYRNQIEKGTATGMAAAREAGPGAILEMLPKLIQGQQDTMADLNKSFAGFDFQGKREYANQLGVQGAYESQAEDFKNNMYWDKYMQAMGTASALRGAGMQNINTGVSDIGGSGANVMQNLYLQKMMSEGGMGIDQAAILAGTN